jgi:hypothetical protein
MGSHARIASPKGRRAAILLGVSAALAGAGLDAAA